MEYLELKVFVPSTERERERLIGFLGMKGFDGFMEEEECLLAYREQGEDGMSPAEIQEEIRQTFGYSSATAVIPDQNWNALWEQSYEDVTIGRILRVRAPFHKPSDAYAYELVIEPKMSFGTAHHPTTRQMLALLLEVPVEGQRVLDMGSGTAVLAILASLRGASLVMAVDNDEWAWRNGMENVARNAGAGVEVVLGDAQTLGGRMFDLILANINRNILLRDIPVYRDCLVAGGSLMMSGFYLSDLGAIREAAEATGMRLLRYTDSEQWVAAHFSLPAASETM